MTFYYKPDPTRPDSSPSSQYYVCNSPVILQANSFSLLTLEEQDQEQREMEPPVEKVNSSQSHNTPDQFLGDHHQGKEEMEELWEVLTYCRHIHSHKA